MPLLTQFWIPHTFLVLMLSHDELLHIVGPSELCAHGALQMLHANEVAMNDGNIACVSSAHLRAPSCHCISLTKHKLKGEIIKNFWMGTVEH